MDVFDLKTSLYDGYDVEGNYVEYDGYSEDVYADVDDDDDAGIGVDVDVHAEADALYVDEINYADENENDNIIDNVNVNLYSDVDDHDKANVLDMEIDASDVTVGTPMDDGDEESVDNADIDINTNNTDNTNTDNSNTITDSNISTEMKLQQLRRRSTLSTAVTVSSSSAASHYSVSQGLSDEVLDDALQDPHLMEKILGRELYEMKPEDREAATNELHGVEFDSNKGGVVGGMQQHRHGHNANDIYSNDTITSNSSSNDNDNGNGNNNDRAAESSSSSSSKTRNRTSNETTKESPEKTAFFLAEMQDVLDELVLQSSVSLSDDDDDDDDISGNINGSNHHSNHNHHGNRRREYHAYRRGLELNSEYIRTPEYRLKFLRADRFDARKAATRYCNCLDLLLKSFGEKIFRRQLYLSDLNSLEQKYFRDGNVQVLPSRDRIGRRVVVFIKRHDANTPEEYAACFRLLIYLTWTVPVQDVTTQVKGAVVLIFPTFEDSTNMAKHTAKKLNQIINTLPMRYSAIHFGIPNSPIFNVVRSLCLLLIGPEGRRVCRIHTGSPVEVDYALSSYGINIKDIPRTYTFMIKTKNWARFVKVRTAIDNFQKKSKNRGAVISAMDRVDHRQSQSHSEQQQQQQIICGVECPEVNCILFGNKAMAWDHPGNIEFRDLIEEKELERERRPKSFSFKGHRYNDHIIDEGRLGKFVYMEYDKKNLWYTEITDNDVLRHKITQLLTGIRKRRKATRMAQKMRIDCCSSSMPLSSENEICCANDTTTTTTTPIHTSFDGALYKTTTAATTNPCGGFHSFAQNK